jgi:hypothetical protein
MNLNNSDDEIQEPSVSHLKIYLVSKPCGEQAWMKKVMNQKLIIGKRYLVKIWYETAWLGSPCWHESKKWEEAVYEGVGTPKYVHGAAHMFATVKPHFDSYGRLTRLGVPEGGIERSVREIPAPDTRGKALRNHWRSLERQGKLDAAKREELQAQPDWNWKFESFTSEEQAQMLADLRAFCKLLMDKHLFLVGYKIVIRKDGLKGPYLAYCSESQKEIGFIPSHAAAIYYDADKVEQTLRHEIAHALCPKDEGHGELWVRKAYELGCRGFHGAKTKVVEKVLEEAGAPAGTYHCRRGCSVTVVEEQAEA